MNSVTIEREIRARPSIVFDLLATPEGLTAWWGPDRHPVLSAEADVRPGGSFCVRFRTDDGLEHECVGTFLEIEPPKRIVMSWRWTSGGVAEELGTISRVEIRVRPAGTGTKVTLIHNGLHGGASETSHRYGWTGALDKLVGELDAMPPPRDAQSARSGG